MTLFQLASFFSQCLRCFFTAWAIFLVSSLSAEPVAAPIPNNEKTAPKSELEAGQRAAAAKWNQAKFGLFLHWGVYSVYGGTYNGQDLWSAEWIQENARIPYEEYAKTAAAWNPKDFDADVWVRTARDAGMRYIVVTAKHHDGFAIYPTKASRYHLFASGAYQGADPIAALKKACQKYGLLFGIYYSPLEFRGSPKGFDDADHQAVAAGFDYRTLGPKPYASDRQIAKLAKAQIRELAEWYQPDIFWFDGTWYMMGNWTDEDAKESEAIIRAVIPNVMINNRLGLKHADFNTFENEIPHEAPQGAWEYCWNMGAFWGYNPRNYTPELMKNPEHYLETLGRIASLGGNYLLNVGPDGTGKFHPMATTYLQKIGEWVNPHRAMFDGVSGSPFSTTPAWGYVTCKDGVVYLMIRQSACNAPIAIPALSNRFKSAHLLTDANVKVEVKEGAQEWQIGPVVDAPQQPFVVVQLNVEGHPKELKK
ncbi:MAG: hypothetical protein EAZ81_04590 [Verrucomicrobia bacterium]|jgi:alpha-L-fucosidase|nr:MAG: hypothetical protein EAZ81_04590 [Verrucomicrobiota bacterium]